MRRRRTLLLLALLTVALCAYALYRLPAWSSRYLADSLTGFFHRPVRVGEVRFRLFPLQAEVRDLTVAGLTADAPPFLEVARAQLTPSLAPLRGRRLVLSRIRIAGLRIRINAFPDPPNGPGGDDIPKMGGGSGRGLEVSVSRLVIAGGEFMLNHDRVPLDLDLPEFHGRLVDERGQGLRGHVSFRPGELRFGAAPNLSLGTEMDLRFNRGLLTVEAGRVYTTGIDLGYQGRLRLSNRPQGQFNLSGPVDLAVLEKHVMRSGLGLEGTGRWDGVLAVDGSRLRVEGRMDGVDGAFRGTAVRRFSGQVAYDGNGLRIRELDVESLGGQARQACDEIADHRRQPELARDPSQRGRKQQRDADVEDEAGRLHRPRITGGRGRPAARGRRRRRPRIIEPGGGASGLGSRRGGRSEDLELPLDRGQLLRGSLDLGPLEPLLRRGEVPQRRAAEDDEEHDRGVVEGLDRDRVDLREHEQDEHDRHPDRGDDPDRPAPAAERPGAFLELRRRPSGGGTRA